MWQFATCRESMSNLSPGRGAANHGCSRLSGGFLLVTAVSALQQEDPIRWYSAEPPRKAAAARIGCPTSPIEHAKNLGYSICAALLRDKEVIHEKTDS